MRINRPIVQILMTSQIFGQISKKWRHVTSRDVVMSDFEKKFKKYLSYWYCVAVQIWRHLHHLNGSYGQLRFLQIWSRDNEKAKWRPRASFSDTGSYMILNQRKISFPTVYDMTPFWEKKYFLPIWRHRPQPSDVTKNLAVQRFSF